MLDLGSAGRGGTCFGDPLLLREAESPVSRVVVVVDLEAVGDWVEAAVVEVVPPELEVSVVELESVVVVVGATPVVVLVGLVVVVVAGALVVVGAGALVVVGAGAAVVVVVGAVVVVLAVVVVVTEWLSATAGGTAKAASTPATAASQ